MMFRKRSALALLLAGAMALAACGAPAQPTAQPQTTAAQPTDAPATAAVSPLPTPSTGASPLAPPRAEVPDATSLVAALGAAGATVEMGDRIEQPFFEVQGQVLRVNGQPVEVFEWADEASREAVSGTITPEGQFGTTMVEWVGTPYFWASGKLIVLYVGENAEVVRLMTAALGAPIAQG